MFVKTKSFILWIALLVQLHASACNEFEVTSVQRLKDYLAMATQQTSNPSPLTEEIDNLLSELVLIQSGSQIITRPPSGNDAILLSKRAVAMQATLLQLLSELVSANAILTGDLSDQVETLSTAIISLQLDIVKRSSVLSREEINRPQNRFSDRTVYDFLADDSAEMLRIHKLIRDKVNKT